MVFSMVFTTFGQKLMKTIVNTILFLISDANSLKVPKNAMFYNFRVVAGACGSQWRGAPQKGPGPPGRKVWKIHYQKSSFYKCSETAMQNEEIQELGRQLLESSVLIPPRAQSTRL